MIQLFSPAIFTASLFVILCTGTKSAEIRKSCKETSTSCPCGKSNSNFTATLKTCLPIESMSSLESEDDWLRNIRVCAKFENCATCDSGSHKCASCPAGKSGTYCNEGKDEESGGRTKRSLCAIPKYMDTNTYHCYEEKHEYHITCIIHCDKDHSLPEGKFGNITCDTRYGIWQPHGFIECEHSKFKDCAEKEMLESGQKTREDKPLIRKKRDTARLCEVPKTTNTTSVECRENESEITCEQTCKDDYILDDGSTRRSIQCSQLTGLWKPKDFKECKKRKTVKRSALCAVPTHMETNTFECNENSNIITCVQTCNEGYTFQEGPKRTIACKTFIGNWRPVNFQQCDKKRIVKRSALCAVPTHMETNTFECHENKRTTTCHQTCNEGYTFREGPKRTITCKNSVGNWRPHDFQQCIKKRNRRDTDVNSSPRRLRRAACP